MRVKKIISVLYEVIFSGRFCTHLIMMTITCAAHRSSFFRKKLTFIKLYENMIWGKKLKLLCDFFTGMKKAFLKSKHAHRFLNTYLQGVSSSVQDKLMSLLPNSFRSRKVIFHFILRIFYENIMMRAKRDD